MAGINEKDFIDELRFDIKEKDMIKAKLVLNHINEVSANVQKQSLFELSRASPDADFSLCNFPDISSFPLSFRSF